MSNREKIIVVVMILTLIFGGISFLGKSSVRLFDGKKDNINELNQFIAKTVEQLNRNEGKISGYILKTASLALDNDPFLKMEAVAVSTSEKSRPEGLVDRPLRYSGYLQVGNKHFAIINNYEYEIKESIEPYGFIVQQITPEKVILETMGRERVVLPIEE